MYTHNGVMGSSCPLQELVNGYSPDTCVHRPFIGDIKGLFHNCSGLFCTDIPKRNIKLKKLDSQLMSFDFVSLGEAHIDAEKCAVFNSTTSHTPSYNFWLPGNSGGDGGLGILVFVLLDSEVAFVEEEDGADRQEVINQGHCHEVDRVAIVYS